MELCLVSDISNLQVLLLSNMQKMSEFFLGQLGYSIFQTRYLLVRIILPLSL